MSRPAPLRAIGVHLCDSGRVRHIVLERKGDGTKRLIGYGEDVLGESGRADEHDAASLLDHLAGWLADGVARTYVTSGPVDLAVAVTDRWFQFRRAPLETASAEDRQRQILWEASQALLAPLTDYDIKCLASDRSGIWMAIRKGVSKRFEDAAVLAGFRSGRTVPLPLALVQGCDLARRSLPEGPVRVSAVHLEEDRAWMVSLGIPESSREDLQLRSLEAAPGSRGNAGQPDAVDAAVRWIRGDRTRADRHHDPGRPVVSGDEAPVGRLVQRLSSAGPVIYLNPFAAVDSETTTPAAPASYAPAAGAAWSLLKGNTP